MFVLFSGYLVFLMQCGFAMLTAGSVRTKNTKNVLLKNVLDACVGAIAFYIFGWAFAYGPGGNAQGFIGAGNFALSSYDGVPFTDFTSFFFQWAFAATAATIVSGSVAERTSFYAYMGYAFFLTSFVYPVVAHWVWGGGFLSTFLGQGMIDFAGCSVVHMVGGFAGLAGAIIVGPRFGRFNSDGKPMPLPGHSATLATLGTFLLWFGWYGFNPGSALGITGGLFATVQRCAVTTTIAAAVGGLTTLIVKKLLDHFFDLLSVLNGILAGLVAITASCAFVDIWAAIIIGFIGALVYVGSAMALLFFKIDDPLEAFPIHGATGFWGCLAAGFFNRKEFQEVAGFDNPGAGVIDGSGRLLLTNFVGCLIIIGWVLGLLVPFFLLLKFLGILRISREEELIGNDISKHGGVAYPDDAVDVAGEAARKDMDSLAMDPGTPSEVDKV
ncbi:Ammonium Transporter [Gracilaria domingensis]|nr:Ammonium Transporter [Gracilaria domingensis]